MKPEMTCLLFPLMIGVGALLVKASNAETRSKKLGSIALACGVAGFIPALLGPTFKEPDQVQALTNCGVFTILFAVAALVLAIWTFRVRRRDHGVVPIYPVAALMCGAANLFCGVGIFVTGVGVLIPTDGTVRTWQSEKHGFEVTVPSERWVEKSNPNVLAQFGSSRPAMAGIIADARSAQSDTEWQAAVNFGKKVRDDTPTTNTEEQTGPNRNGHSYWSYMGDARKGNTTYFFGISITRVREKAVIMMVEGEYRLNSEAGRRKPGVAYPGGIVPWLSQVASLAAIPQLKIPAVEVGGL